MKLTFISHEFPPLGGGGATSLDYMTRALVARGHQVQIVTIGHAKLIGTTEDIPGRTIIRIDGKRKRLLAPSAIELTLGSLLLLIKSNELIKRFKPDYIIGYFAFPAGVIANILGRKHTIPVITSLRGSDVPGFHGGRWKKLAWIQNLLVKPAYLYSEGVYANGTALQALAQKFTPKKPIHNIPNGVDTETFYPTNTNETDTLKLLYVGQLISRKRIEEILQTLHHFGNKHSIKLHISIVGDGPLMPSIKLLCQSLPNSISYTLHGQLDRAALPEIYRNHHILLQLSKAEGVSNTVLEGIASGLHLIASDSAAGELDIEGKAFCRFIDCNDKDELTRNLGDTLVEINKRKKTIIKKSQKEAVTFIKKYSWDERAKELEKYLKKVAK